MATIELASDPAVAGVLERVRATFQGQVEIDVIDATVERWIASFADARIRDFVPMFIERRSGEELRSLAQQRR
jgi:hypothetical protein